MSGEWAIEPEKPTSWPRCRTTAACDQDEHISLSGVMSASGGGVLDLPGREHVTLTIYNALGQQVSTLVNQEMQAGVHTVTLDGSNLSSGIYVYRLQTESESIVRQMLLVK
jgi:hypothetical protein